LTAVLPALPPLVGVGGGSGCINIDVVVGVSDLPGTLDHWTVDRASVCEWTLGQMSFQGDRVHPCWWAGSVGWCCKMSIGLPELFIYIYLCIYGFIMVYGGVLFFL